MSIFVIGINYKTAPIHVREKLYFPLDKLALCVQDILQQGYASEAVLMSTCNRSELYCEGAQVNSLIDWLCMQAALPREVLEPLLYIYEDEQAVAHLMKVACGLDSMILGEPQIFGQLKAAFAESCTAGAVSSALHRLFQYIFMLAKEIRTTTAIGACPVSVASAAAHFAKTQHPNFEKANIVLIGAGDTCALLLRYLKVHADVTLSLVNRNRENALALADEFAIPAYGLDELPEVLMHADVVFSATGSPIPLITQNLIHTVMRSRPQKPLSLIDIAVPRDIEATVNEIEYVSLYCIDDLKSIIEVNRQGREHAASKAYELISMKSAAFMSQYHSQDKVNHTIRTYRSQIEDICRYELKKAKQQIHEGKDAQVVLDAFAHNFTNKLLHAPSVQLRKAGAQGRFDLLHFAKKLFALHETEVELP